MTDDPAPSDTAPAPSDDGPTASDDADSTVGASADAADGSRPSRPRLARGRGKDKVLAGVCAGGGRYFGVDPVIFRVVLAVLSLTGGIGLIIYGMGWLLVPQEGERESEAHRLLSGRIEGAPLTAVLTALVGCGLYASTIGSSSNQAFSLLLLAATAGAVYWSHARRRLEQAGEAAFTAPGAVGARPPAAAAPEAPPAVKAPPEPGGPSWWREPLAKEPPYLWGPADGRASEQDRKVWKERKKAARRIGWGWLFGFTAFVLALAAGGGGFAVSLPHQAPGAAVEIGLACALGVFGAAFVVASWWGRAGTGTVFLALVTLAGLICAASLPKDAKGWSSTWRPATADSVRSGYERAVGSGTLDLRALELDGRTVSAHMEVDVGEAVVRLPPGATVVLEYDLGVGDVLLPGKAHTGVHVKSGKHASVVLPPPAGARSTGTLDLHVQVGVGQVRVVR